MPERAIRSRGGAIGYRTITVGRGRNKKTIRIAVVPKAGKRGGHTIGWKTGKLWQS